MVSKPNKAKVRKVSSATPVPPKSPKQQNRKQVEIAEDLDIDYLSLGKKKSQAQPAKSAEQLIRHNGDLVESLFSSQAWVDIVFPVIQEMIAGVSGRFTNGRFYHGTITKDWKGESPVFCAGYQKGLVDFYNNLHDFILARDKQIADKKKEREDKNAPLVDPFMENEDA